jgi:hypothetical protein
MRFSLLSVLFFLAAIPALAHEFWIAPQEYVIDTDQPVKAQLRIGSNFDGAVQRFFKQQFTRFEVYHKGTPIAVEGRLGDDPALNIPALGDGLLIVVYESTDSVLTYRKPELFANFVTHKGVPELIEQNRNRGFPVMDFREKFRRFVKSLIAAGSGRGQDISIGMRAEIVALANPYTDELTKGFPVQVYYEGKPRPNAFLQVFMRSPDGDVSVLDYHADNNGVANIQVIPGTEYLVDATMILPLPNEDIEAGPVWESLWAGLTFMVPLP